jgi:cell division protein FtsW (lipid II flippase)
LIIFGLVVLSSASSPLGYTRFQDAYFFVKKQVFYGLIPGLLLAFIASRVRVLWKGAFICRLFIVTSFRGFTFAGPCQLDI